MSRSQPQLAGMTALVTGSTKGVGAEIARQFAAAGASVVLTGRNQSRGAAMQRLIRDEGGEAIFVALDIGVEEQVAHAMEAAVTHYGRLDVLVNNAAPIDVVMGGDGSATDLSTQDLQSILTPGLFGQFWECKYALPHLCASGSGAIVNISAAASKIGVPKAAAYTIAKGALNALSRQIAVDFGASGLRSNTIVIGHVATADVRALFDENPALEEAFDALTLTAAGTPADVAAAALFLASESAKFITGIELRLDGGMLAARSMPAVSGLEHPSVQAG